MRAGRGDASLDVVRLGVVRLGGRTRCRRRARCGRARGATPRRAALAIAALMSGAPALVAASLAGAPSFSPADYGPGQEAIASAPLLPAEGETLSELSLEPGSGLPLRDGSEDPELLGLAISRTPSGWELRIRFVPWSPGSGLVPGVKVSGIALPAVPYSASSRLGPEDNDPTPPRPQRLPPGSRLALALVAISLAALALAIFGFVAYLLPASRALLARWRAGQAFRRLGKVLDYLAARAQSADPAAYAAAVAGALRAYLAARVAPEAPALTPAELSGLPDAAFPAPATRDRAAELLAWSDAVRFGGERAGAASLVDAAERARFIAAENEEALLARP